jgi:hypothetical protein
MQTAPNLASRSEFAELCGYGMTQKSRTQFPRAQVEGHNTALTCSNPLCPGHADPAHAGT